MGRVVAPAVIVWRYALIAAGHDGRYGANDVGGVVHRPEAVVLSVLAGTAAGLPLKYVAESVGCLPTRPRLGTTGDCLYFTACWGC